MIEIYIDGVVAMPNRGGAGAAHEEFWGEFVTFVESKGWLFGGGTGIVKSDSTE